MQRPIADGSDRNPSIGHIDSAQSKNFSVGSWRGENEERTCEGGGLPGAKRAGVEAARPRAAASRRKSRAVPSPLEKTREM